jgi:hypothetical protein
MSTFNLSAVATTSDPATLIPSAGSRTARPFARYATTGARCLLGALWLFFGLNGFLNFLPPPSTPIPPAAAAFGGALMSTGYMFQLIAGTEVVAGLSLLTARWVPLALVLLAPLVVNILAFHVFLAPSGLGVPAVLLAIQLFLAWRYRDAYRPLLQPRTAPSA